MKNIIASAFATIYLISIAFGANAQSLSTVLLDDLPDCPVLASGAINTNDTASMLVLEDGKARCLTAEGWPVEIENDRVTTSRPVIINETRKDKARILVMEDRIGELRALAGLGEEEEQEIVDPPSANGAIISSSVIKDNSPTEVEITWNLDQVAQGRIDYGTTPALGSSTIQETSLNFDSHRQTITGLTPATTYHYRIIAIDANNVETYLPNDTDTLTFTTLAASTPPVSSDTFSGYPAGAGIGSTEADGQPWGGVFVGPDNMRGAISPAANTFPVKPDTDAQGNGLEGAGWAIRFTAWTDDPVAAFQIPDRIVSQVDYNRSDRGQKPGTRYYTCRVNNLTFLQCSWHLNNTYRNGNPGLRLSFYNVASDGGVGTLISQGTELTYPEDVSVKVEANGGAHNRWDGLVLHAPEFTPTAGARYYAVIENMKPPTGLCKGVVGNWQTAVNCQTDEGWMSINGTQIAERPSSATYNAPDALPAPDKLPASFTYGPAVGNGYIFQQRFSETDEWQDIHTGDSTSRDNMPYYRVGRIGPDGGMYFEGPGIYNPDYNSAGSSDNLLATNKIYRQTIGQIANVDRPRKGWSWPDTDVDGIWLGVKFNHSSVPEGGTINVTIRDEADLSVLATATVPVNCADTVAVLSETGSSQIRYSRAECPIYADLSNTVTIETGKIYYVDLVPSHSNRYRMLGYKVFGNTVYVDGNDVIQTRQKQWECYNFAPPEQPELCASNYGTHGVSTFNPENDFNGEAYVINSTNPAGAMVHWKTAALGRTSGANNIGTDISVLFTTPTGPRFTRWD